MPHNAYPVSLRYHSTNNELDNIPYLKHLVTDGTRQHRKRKRLFNLTAGSWRIAHAWGQYTFLSSHLVSIYMQKEFHRENDLYFLNCYDIVVPQTPQSKEFALVASLHSILSIRRNLRYTAGTLTSCQSSMTEGAALQHVYQTTFESNHMSIRKSNRLNTAYYKLKCQMVK